jgi:hypothetical protein
MNKLPYNCFIDRKGYVMPKSAVIKLTPDLIEWLSTDNAVRFLFMDKPNTKILDKEWLEIGISHSYVGNIYCSVWSWDMKEFNEYFVDNPYVKIFDEDDEAFMKYMKWVAKLGPWFTKQRFKKD